MNTDFQQWDVISRDVDGIISTCLIISVDEHVYTLYYIAKNWGEKNPRTFSILVKLVAAAGGWRKVGYLKLNADFEIET